MIKTKSLIISGTVVIGLAFLLFVYLGLVNLGIIHTKTSKIVVKSEDLTVEYDGKEHKMEEIKLIDGILFDGHTLKGTFNGSQTNVGRSPNYVTAIILDSNDVDVTYLYEIETQYGELEVLRIPLIITTASETKDFDGEELFNDEYEVYGDLMRNDYILSNSYSSITLPGSIENRISIEIRDKNNRVVTQNYEIAFSYGELLVEKINLQFTSASITEVYSEGSVLENGNNEPLNMDTNEYLIGHSPIIKSASRLDVIGSIDNIITVVIVDSSGKDVSNYYNINYIWGKLSLIPSIYSGSIIEKEQLPFDDNNVFSYDTRIKNTIYFRDKSYGNYEFSNDNWVWNAPKPYQITNNRNNMSVLNVNNNLYLSPFNITAELLRANNYNQEDITINPIRKQVPYLTPYFSLTNKDNSDIHNHDSFVTKDKQSYHQSMFAENLFSMYQSLDTTLLPTEYKALEYEYSKFINEHYLSIDNDTKNSILELNIVNNSTINKHEIYTLIKEYVSSLAQYDASFNYKELDTKNYILDFILYGDKADAQLFASAATLIYRAYGIPARYVTGFISDSDINNNVVRESNAHAWVEIYIEKIGWINIEVTPGFGGIPLTVGVNYYEKVYDGIGIDNNNLSHVILAGELIQGHYINNVSYYETSRYINADNYNSSIRSLNIYDEFGNDVTNLYSISLQQGNMNINGRAIKATTSNISFEYDGLEHTNLNQNDLRVDGLVDGHYIADINYSGSITNVGSTTNRANYLIYDRYGNDVTRNYIKINNLGQITIKPKTIYITLVDATKKYDGSALESNDFIVEDHFGFEIIHVETEGSQTEIGRSINIVSSVTIFIDSIDVTSNYEINTIEGYLTVRR